MMNISDTIFSNRKMNEKNLLEYGFIAHDDYYSWTSSLLDGKFELNVIISTDGKVSTKVIDCALQEEYVLFRISDAVGEFVGNIRKAHDDKLLLIADKCFDLEIFKSVDSHSVIEYIAKRYGDKPEFLWPRFADNAIFRRQDNSKWYAALLTVSKSKIGLNGDGKIEILDLKVLPSEVDTLVDGKKFFPGYHMNKRSWFMLCLDGSVDREEIFALIDQSYQLASKK